MSGEDAPLRVLVVDDEEPARLLLAEYLSALDDVEQVGECADGMAAVKAAAELHPDVILLDVRMPGLDGFEVVELLDPGPAVIFVTAYDRYALRAFDVNAVDYLLKPFTRERLAEAVRRARARGPRPAAELAAAARPEGRWRERIVIREGAEVIVVAAGEVEYLEAQGDYVAVHARGKVHLKRIALGSLADSLDPARFVRIHRSYVVPARRVIRVETPRRDRRVVVLHGGARLPVSRSGWARLRERLGEGGGTRTGDPPAGGGGVP